MSEPPSFELPGDDEVLLDALDDVRRAVLRHPVAAREIFAALVREGRRHAETPAGAELAEQLRRSERFARARHVWRATTSWLLEGAAEESALPSTLVDALLAAAEREDLPALLEKSALGRRRR